MIKPVEEIFEAPAPHWVGNGFKVHNFFPGGTRIGNSRMSPFYMLDYNARMELSPTNDPRGVDTHPHRGFETVTLAYEGKVAHHDSAGNSGIIEPGDVQWMTAGSGVLHKEYHEKEFSSKGGSFQMVQLWVNLPARYKMTPPRYQALSRDKMGKFQVPGNGGHVDVIAGEYGGIKGPAQTNTPMHVYNLYLNAQASIAIKLPAHYNTGILLLAGKVIINKQTTVNTNCFALFKNEGEEIQIETTAPAVILLLSGEPIAEPIAAYGPFLMNTQEEIMQAIQDYNQGRFGQLD